MVRREPDGDDATEVTIAYVRQLERRLADLEAWVAGKLPHDHDSRYDDRYVHEAGDTMTGELKWTSGWPVVERTDSSGNVWTIRLDIIGDNDSPRINIRKNGNLYQTFQWDESAGVWTISADLQVNGVLRSQTDPPLIRETGAWSPKFDVASAGASGERIELYGDPSHGGLLRIFTNDFSRDFEFRVRDAGGGGTHGRSAYVDPQGNWELFYDLDVTGAKNALIVDPDDATKAFRYACVEADEPGLLFHRLTVTIPSGGNETTVGLPEHWARIARDGDAMVTPLNDTRDQAPAAAAVDLTVPEVTVRGKPGDYRVWIAAARADDGVDGWTHEVQVDQDDV